MVVRVLLLLAVLATLYGCGQANTPSEHPGKKGTEKSAGQSGKGLTGAAPNHDASSQEGSPEQGSVSTGVAPTVAEKRGRPNIIFILTDDLDAHPGSISHMPNLQRYLVDHGTTFDNAFVTNALCCPSRATILRGQYSHNHGVLTNSAPLGGEQRFSELGLEDSTVATWLHSEGYRTVLFGKYLNHFEPPVPPGWDLWYSRGIIPPGTYETDFYAYEASNLIKGTKDESQPFFMWLGTSAPHANVDPPPRYDEAFPGSTAPRPPSFNEGDVSDKPRWLKGKPPLSESEISGIDEQYRNRLRTMLAVDDLIGTLVKALGESGELDNTYIFFTSDNGFVMGEHRRTQGKWSAYEEAIRVPLIVRGPGVAEGETLHNMVLNNDFAPTFATLSGASAPSFVDGRSFVPLLRSSSSHPSNWRSAFLEEALASDTGRPAFKAIRTTDHLWVEYADGERELYNLSEDPYELESQHMTAPNDLKQDLAGRLDRLRDCSREGCSDAEGF
jgi:N-acetylglucosamine-6-sulfatase